MNDLLSALTSVVARHDSLRTIVNYSQDGTGFQTVHAPPRSADDIEHVVDVVDRSVIDEATERRLASPFDVRREWPFKFTVAREGGRASGVHLAIDHSATDGWGLKVLGEDLLSLLGAGSATTFPAVAQPLDTVAWEDSPEGIRRSGVVLTYWRRQLERLASTIDSEPAQDSGFVSGISGTHHLTSKRLRVAAEQAGEGFGVSMDTVFLCAFGWALTLFNDTKTVGVLGMNLNRSSPAEMRSAALRFTQSPLLLQRPRRGPVERPLKQLHCDRQESMFLGHAPPGEIDAIVSEVLPDAMSPSICGALFSYLRPDFGRSLPGLEDDQGLGDVDEVFREDPVMSRGPKLMLTVDFIGSRANMRLISDVGSRLHNQGLEFLRLMADCIYWMASGDDWSNFPYPQSRQRIHWHQGGW